MGKSVLNVVGPKLVTSTGAKYVGGQAGLGHDQRSGTPGASDSSAARPPTFAGRGPWRAPRPWSSGDDTTRGWPRRPPRRRRGHSGATSSMREPARWRRPAVPGQLSRGESTPRTAAHVAPASGAGTPAPDRHRSTPTRAPIGLPPDNVTV